MMLVTIVTGLQIVCGLMWLVCLVAKAPSFYRVLHNVPQTLDLIRAILFIIAASQVIGMVRWLVFNNTMALMSAVELLWWAGVYLLSIMGAGATIWYFQVRGKALQSWSR